MDSAARHDRTSEWVQFKGFWIRGLVSPQEPSLERYGGPTTEKEEEEAGQVYLQDHVSVPCGKLWVLMRR